MKFQKGVQANLQQHAMIILRIRTKQTWIAAANAQNALLISYAQLILIAKATIAILTESVLQLRAMINLGMAMRLMLIAVGIARNCRTLSVRIAIVALAIRIS